jgi:hypothetical protein
MLAPPAGLEPAVLRSPCPNRRSVTSAVQRTLRDGLLNPLVRTVNLQTQFDRDADLVWVKRLGQTPQRTILEH